MTCHAHLSRKIGMTPPCDTALFRWSFHAPCGHALTYALLNAGKTEAKLATKPADLKNKKKKKGGIRIRKGVVVQARCAQPSARSACLTLTYPAVYIIASSRQPCVFMLAFYFRLSQRQQHPRAKIISICFCSRS